MSHYRIRLDDGSEVGPLDVAQVRDWYRKGLADGNTLVMEEGVRGWRPLADILGIKRKGTPGKGTAARQPSSKHGGTSRPMARSSGGGLGIWIVAGLVLVAAIGGGAFLLLNYWSSSASPLVAEAALSERRITDSASSLVLDLPRGWYALRVGSDLVPAPAGANPIMVDAKNRLRGYLLAESQPPRVTFVQDYLPRVLEQAVLVMPALEISSRQPRQVGGLPGLRVIGTWKAMSTGHDEVVTLWRDGWLYYALTIWGPSGSASEVERASDAILEGISGQGTFEQQTQEAVARITKDVPQLTPAAAEILMAQSQVRTIAPEAAFRLALATLARGIPSLSKEDSRELGRLTSALYGTMTARSRARLDAYVRRVRSQEATSPELDREMAGAVRASVLSLSAARRVRLQAIYEKAIRNAAGPV
jgi:hypothetical protein